MQSYKLTELAKILEIEYTNTRRALSMRKLQQTLYKRLII